MLKVFNDSNIRFVLEAGGEKVTVVPGKFIDLDEKFTADVTFRVAVEGGALKVYDDISAAEKLVKDHTERPVEEPEAPITVEDTKTKTAAKKTAKK